MVWISFTVFTIYISVRAVIAYTRWNSRQETLLGKLESYKKQLDRRRSPLPDDKTSDKNAILSLAGVALPSRVYDRSGSMIGEFFTERRTLINLEKIPEYASQALIVSEDKKFYSHHGIDYAAVSRAMLKNLLHLRFLQGGSTITQQLAKVLFTNQEKTLDRKFYEYFCAREIEDRYTKKEILEMYLNLVYMGHSNYGIEAASQQYFGKSSASITLAEAAFLVGLLPNPDLYSPVNGLNRALERQKLVLNAMASEKHITPEQRDSYLLSFNTKWKIRETNGKVISSIADFPDRNIRLNLAPFFLDHIRQKLAFQFSADVINKGGLKIYTSLDFKRQQVAHNQIRIAVERQKQYYDNLIQLARQKKDTSKVAEYEEAQKTTHGAFITLEPRTGYVLTMVGGYDFSQQNQLNRVTQSNRRIGSLIKPLIYYLGLSKKEITPATILEDTALEKFQNPDGKYLGNLSAREALKRSRNIPAVKVLKKIDFDDLRQVFNDILHIPYSEIEKRIPRDLSVATGTPAFSVADMAQVYATLVNQGKRVYMRDLLRVEDNDGRLLWENTDPLSETEVLDPVAAYITLTMLQAVTEKGGTASNVYTILRKSDGRLPFEIAGKTGTSPGNADAWFVGMTSDEVSVIWVGNDKASTLGGDRTGSSISAPRWADYIKAVRTGGKPKPFSENWPLEGTVVQSFCNASGGVPRFEGSCPDLIKDQVFFSGTDPKEYDPSGLDTPGDDIPVNPPQ